MIASFDWWLLVVGIVGGAGLVWLVIADFRRHEDDVADDESAAEAQWIAATVSEAGQPVDDHTVGEVLRLHRAYLAAPAPDLDPVGQEAEAGPEAEPEPGASSGPEAGRDDRGAAGIVAEADTEAGQPGARGAATGPDGAPDPA